MCSRLAWLRMRMCKPSPWDTALGQHSHAAGASARALPGAAGTQSSCGVSVTSLRGAGTPRATTSPLPVKVGVLCSVADGLQMQFPLTTPRTGLQALKSSSCISVSPNPAACFSGGSSLPFRCGVNRVVRVKLNSFKNREESHSMEMPLFCCSEAL